MRMYLKRPKKKGKMLSILLMIITAIVVGTFMFINYLSDRAGSLIMAYANSETKKLIMLVINKAVTKQINNVDMNEIFDVTYNNNGEVILIDFNSKRTSVALSTITNLIELNLRAIEEGKIDMLDLPDNSLDVFDTDLLKKGIILEVPFGMVTNISLLNNLGPKIPVRLSLVGDVSTGFSTDVNEYGINNALLKLYIDVEVNARVVLPIISDEVAIQASIPIAMKVIQGKIPDYYINGFTTKSNIAESE